MNHGIENVVRVNDLMYKGCEPHWKCVKCGDCAPFHCFSKKEFAELKCKHSVSHSFNRQEDNHYG